MIRIKNKRKCSGCHACANVCPKQCISMIPDDEGFLYPVVDKEKCIRCGLCKSVCHSFNPLVSKNSPDAYACHNMNEDIRMSSSSGGMFTLLAEEILAQGGVVFGAAFDENLGVKHICVERKEELHKLRGSKYVQSIIGDTYKQARGILESGRIVLFTGTPCQINGLLLYLRKEYDNLYTQDLICHGVPSPKLWKLYLTYQEKLHESKIDNTNFPSFRSKVSGWLNYSVQMHFENGTDYIMPFRKDLYMNAFLGDFSIRPSCYNGDCKSVHRNSDITLADFWGADLLIPSMFDDKGTSLVFVNTEKGRRFFDKIKKFAEYTQTDIKGALRFNPMAYKPAPCPSKRKELIKNVVSSNFEALQNMRLKRNLPERVVHKVKGILRKYRNKLY